MVYNFGVIKTIWKSVSRFYQNKEEPSTAVSFVLPGAKLEWTRSRFSKLNFARQKGGREVSLFLFPIYFRDAILESIDLEGNVRGKAINSKTRKQ